MSLKELKRIIQVQKQGGASYDEAKAIVETIVRSNGSLDMDQALVTLETMFGETREQSLSRVINDYIHSVTGHDINVTDLDKELGIVTQRDRTNRRQILHRLCEAGILESKGYKVFRFVETEAPIIDIDNVDLSKTVDVVLPFGLHNWIILYPKNIIIVAGSKDAGKTVICNQILKLNNDGKMPIAYFNSEMGPEELYKRLSRMGEGKWWKFKPRERSVDFASVIKPDALNVIDYLELTTDFYKVAEELKQITEKLKKGIAVVAIQKKFNAELAYGAETTLWKSRLYVTIDYIKQNKLWKLVVKSAKNPRVEGVSIKDWEWKFRIRQGYEIEILEEPQEIVDWSNEIPEEIF